MSCNCGCFYGCRCADGGFLSCDCCYCVSKPVVTTSTTTTTTTICPGEQCAETYLSDEFVYKGPTLTCFGIEDCTPLTEILSMIANSICNPPTTTTSSTTTTTTINCGDCKSYVIISSGIPASWSAFDCNLQPIGGSFNSSGENITVDCICSETLELVNASIKQTLDCTTTTTATPTTTTTTSGNTTTTTTSGETTTTTTTSACLCYRVDGTADCTVNWIDCNGDPQTFNGFDKSISSIMICAQVGTVDVVGLFPACTSTITANGPCTDIGDCPTTTTVTPKSNVFVENQLTAGGAEISDITFDTISIPLDLSYPILPTNSAIGNENNGTYNVEVFFTAITVTGSEVISLTDSTGATVCNALFGGQSSQVFLSKVLDDNLGIGNFTIVLKPGPC